MTTKLQTKLWPILVSEAGLVTTANSKLYPYGDVRRYGVVGTGDDSTALQLAINLGISLDFVGLTISAHGITQSTDYQKFYSSRGIARLQKNGNGTLFSSTGANVELRDISFRGDAASPTYTGDGVVATGDNFSMINCGSRWISGRPVKATGQHVQILGTSDIYQTTDATATGYDIEIGVSGTATLYHKIYGVYTSQSTGGILMTDVGGHTVSAGQFGKLTVKSGTGPAGTNGGMYEGNRVTGNTLVELSSALFTSNQFANGTSITFAAGSSGCRLDTSNITGTATITNLGNQNNLIMREVSAASTNQIKVGDDNSFAILTFAPTSPGQISAPEFVVPNNQAFRLNQSSGANGAFWSLSAADDMTLANQVSGKAATYTVTGTTSGSRHQFNVGGTIRGLFDNSGFSPSEQTNGQRWNHGQSMELLTLSTSGATTDTSASLLPANSIIEAVVVRVTTTITTATDWTVGDPTTANRFAAANATMTAGATSIGLRHQQGGIASDAAGIVQTAAAKVRITTTGTPGAGVVRVVVFWKTFVAPTS